MAKKQKKKGHGGLTIATNKVARHEYFIEDTNEAGVVLEGWEVKSLREGKVQLKESYVFMKNGEAWLNNAHISPLSTVSTHITANPLRSRKLLLHVEELVRLAAAVDRKGYTVVPLTMYWKNNRVKLEIGLGKGKQLHDKRAVSKEKDWNRDKQRTLKNA
ncbi:SsrA-binding protein SmpB [Leucothrix mucor]|jgi:SsrA-binding protein|uniref:SsrA-binding protein SmpB n=1 Tax=Leucothrix mucor TaxID=45248 RepID=UPI0003B75684|nr:SsrA-binding protein SmpB [Leucothrix mucor]